MNVILYLQYVLLGLTTSADKCMVTSQSKTACSVLVMMGGILVKVLQFYVRLELNHCIQEMQEVHSCVRATTTDQHYVDLCRGVWDVVEVATMESTLKYHSSNNGLMKCQLNFRELRSFRHVMSTACLRF